MADAHPDRSPRGDRHGTHTKPDSLRRGEQHHSAKLTEAEVIQIRAHCAAGESHRSVARIYGVSRATIRMIVLRNTWTHIP